MLLAVERGPAHSDDLLRARAVSALAPADRNLATALVLGVLRWQIALDETIKQHLDRPQAKLDPEARMAMRLGAFQLLHLDRIPAHAAIDESVELVKRAGHRFAAGMVNAVLRRISRADRVERDLDREAATRAYPGWLLDRWTRSYGSGAACAICGHGQRAPALSIRLAEPAVEAELQAEGIQLAPGVLLPAARTVLAGDIAATAAFRSGRARIQDEGSQLVAEVAGFVATPVRNGGRILDACAAPGGKTLILAERHPAAHILACEASPQRLAQLRKRLSHLGNRIECRLADAIALKEEAVFDLALADAPCSGTGTLGRNPEIRHRLTAADLPRQAERQRGILQAAVRAARPGGRVVYSTCSLEAEENDEVVAAVLAANPAVRRISIGAMLAGMQLAGILSGAGAERLARCLTPEGALRLLPGICDGFFIAVIEKGQ